MRPMLNMSGEGGSLNVEGWSRARGYPCMIGGGGQYRGCPCMVKPRRCIGTPRGQND